MARRRAPIAGLPVRLPGGGVAPGWRSASEKKNYFFLAVWRSTLQVLGARMAMLTARMGLGLLVAGSVRIPVAAGRPSIGLEVFSPSPCR